MNINELIEKHDDRFVGVYTEDHEALKQFAVELLEMIASDAQKRRDESGMPDFGESIDKALEELRK